MITAAPVSFRDPDGAVTISGDQVFRSVAGHRKDIIAFLQRRTLAALASSGKLVATNVLRDDCPEGGLTLEHPRVWFPSFPNEWPAEMLFAAGQLTLDLAALAFQEGYGLKDATPYNVLFEGPKPAFVDVLSFERREPGDPMWLPYAQFMRMFLLPLLLQKQLGMPSYRLLTGRPHGVEPEEAFARCSWSRRLRPSMLSLVTMPVWLGRVANKGNGVQRQTSRNPELAQFILNRQIGRLRKQLGRVAPRCFAEHSRWSEYELDCTYSAEESVLKRQLVTRWLKDCNSRTVLDIGSNSGCFSRIAAREGARVVALDTDPVVVGRLFRSAQQESLDILPLVLDIAAPTPPSGWRNSERPSFIQRAAGRFDTVFMLAIVHHLLVTERIPLPEIFELAHELTTRNVLIEYVDREDPMFRRLLRGRDALFSHYSQEYFERICQQRFSIIQKQPVKGSLRSLYLLEKK